MAFARYKYVVSSVVERQVYSQKKNLASIVEGVLKHANNLQEFTIEVNPDSFNVELAEFYQSLGVNRLSMGLQGADDDVLKKSGRLYDYETFIRKYDMARRYFDIVNVDLSWDCLASLGRRSRRMSSL